MKNNNFKINIWDLLQSAGKIDNFEFLHEKLPELQWLSDDGISWEVMLQSFDKDSLLVTLTNLYASINEKCDICTKQYIRDIKIDEYSAKFQKKIDKNEITDDEVFKIDWNENINIKDMIIQAIILQEPFAKKCPTCTKKSSEESDDFDYMEWTWNITFR